LAGKTRGHDQQADVSEINARMTSLEEKMAAMNPPLDNMDRRIGRMEKRIELVEAYATKRGWNQFPEAYLRAG